MSTAKGGAVASEGRCDPAAGCTPQSSISAVAASPSAARSRFAGPSGNALGRPPFARSLTRQTACKAPSHPGCGKIGRSWRCAPWYRSPSYDQRRAPYDHPDFNSNALSEDLFSGSLASHIAFKSSIASITIPVPIAIRRISAATRT